MHLQIITRYFGLLLLLLLARIAPAQITGPTSICPGTTYSYQSTYTSSGYSWEVTGGTIIGSIVSRKISVRWDDNSGTINLTTRVPKSGDLNEFSTNVWAYSAGTVSGASNYCGSASGTLSLSGRTGTILRWESSTNGSTWTAIANTSVTQAFTGLTQNTLFRAVVDGGACGLLYSNTASVNVLPIPAKVAVDDAVRCGPGSVTFTASGSGTSYRWYFNNGSLANQSAARSYATPTVSATMTFFVSTVSAAGCESPWATATAIINPLPAVAPSPSVSMECGQSVMISALPPAGNTFYWQDAASGISTANSAGVYTVNTAGYYTQRARNNSTGCWSNPTTTLVTITPVPDAPAVPTGQEDCKKMVFTATAPSSASYYWQTSPAATATANGGSSYRVTAPGTYYLRARSNTSGCWSPATAFSVAEFKPRLSCLDGQPVSFIVANTILKEGITTEDAITVLPAEYNHQVVSYADGFGRTIQQVGVQQSPTRKDIVQVMAYDRRGRQNKSYLPFTASIDGRYDAAATQDLGAFYTVAGTDRATTAKPWAETVFEASPLERVKEKGAAGESWQPGLSTTKTFYRPNNANEVRLWTYDFATGKCSAAGYYAPGELMAAQATDEQGYRKWDYTDKEDRVVMTRKEISGTESATIYYVFDAFARLRMVVQPQGVQELMATAGAWNPDATFISRWCFTYRYDRLGQLAEKQSPGAATVCYVYDHGHHPILSQDGEQRRRNEWSFSRYDAQGRVIMTGIYTHPSPISQEAMQQAADAFGGTPESRTAVNFSTQYGYTISQTFPALSATNSRINVVYYFDDYNFDYNDATADAAFTTGTMTDGPEPSTQSRSLATGTRKRVLGNSQMLLSVFFYDRQGRVIQTVAENHLGGSDLVTSRYDFAGKLMESKQQHRAGADPVNITKLYTYDHAGRQLSLRHQVNDGPLVTLSLLRYNELGQIAEKKLHSTDGSGYLQKVDYRYNIRGWLTKINDAALTEETDLFGLELHYNEGTVSQAGLAYYNGLASEMVYNDRLANQQKAYAYVYDGLGRLNAARFAARGATAWTEQLGGFNEEGISYDRNGNILGLQRYAQPLSSAPRLKTDHFTYAYEGNRLLAADNDPARSSFAFASLAEPTPQYAYDENGNLVADKNRQVDSIGYNELNLPEQLYGADGMRVTYSYDASGNRLSKTVNGSTRNYVSGFEYGADGQLQFFATDEGRVVKTAAGFSYEYYLKDQLENVRVAFDRDPATGKARIIQRTAYYPFGLVQPGSGFSAGQPNRYLFNGKELQEEWGVYNYGARMYDPWLGRWNGLDPLAEKTYSYSPYAYALNNPVTVSDPDGREAIVVSGSEQLTGRYRSNFIDPAIHQLKWLQYVPYDRNFTWIVARGTYTPDELTKIVKIANDMKVNLVTINNAEQLTNYLNAKNLNSTGPKDLIGEQRLEDPITSVTIFSHGVSGIVAMGFGQRSVEEQLNWTIDEAKQLLSNAFAEDAVINFYSCNAATNNGNGQNLAEETNKATAVKTTGYAGRTEYGGMNTFQNIPDRLDRREQGVSRNGSASAPTGKFSEYRVYPPRQLEPTTPGTIAPNK